MTIRDEKQFIQNFWDWRFLDQSFDRDIKVGDIDGFVEAGGRFLFLEGKRAGTPIPKGQFRALTALARLPRIDVIILEGNPPNEVTQWIVLGTEATYMGNSQEFAAFIRTWFEYGIPT